MTILDFIATNYCISLALAVLLYFTVCRAGRFVLILVHGWPPEHWDEDWTPENEQSKGNV